MSKSRDANVRKALTEAGRRLAARGFLVATQGNLSVKLDEQRILITPAGRPKDQLTPDELVIVDRSGTCLDGRGQPSSELLMHLFVYDHRPDVAACVHTHPPYATAFALAGEALPGGVLPEVVVAVGAVPLTEYAPPGTAAVPQSLAPYLADFDAFLLRNHGLLTLGRTLEEACLRHETVEHYAQVVWLARRLGEITPIPADDLKRLDELRRSNRQRPIPSE